MPAPPGGVAPQGGLRPAAFVEPRGVPRLLSRGWFVLRFRGREVVVPGSTR